MGPESQCTADAQARNGSYEGTGGENRETAEKENILLGKELRLKIEQLKVIAVNSYDVDQAQNLQQNGYLQEQLDLAKTKYDEVHAKLDISDELSTKRSAQLDNAVLMNVTQSNNILVQMLQTKDNQLMNTLTKLDDKSAELIEVTDQMIDERTQVMKMEMLISKQVEEISLLNLLLRAQDLYLQTSTQRYTKE